MQGLLVLYLLVRTLIPVAFGNMVAVCGSTMLFDGHDSQAIYRPQLQSAVLVQHRSGNAGMPHVIYIPRALCNSMCLCNEPKHLISEGGVLLECSTHQVSC